MLDYLKNLPFWRFFLEIAPLRLYAWFSKIYRLNIPNDIQLPIGITPGILANVRGSEFQEGGYGYVHK